jgi:hypothetical protein
VSRLDQRFNALLPMLATVVSRHFGGLEDYLRDAWWTQYFLHFAGAQGWMEVLGREVAG